MGGDDKKNDDGKYHEYYILKLSFLVRSKTLLKILIYFFLNCFLLFFGKTKFGCFAGPSRGGRGGGRGFSRGGMGGGRGGGGRGGFGGGGDEGNNRGGWSGGRGGKYYGAFKISFQPI